MENLSKRQKNFIRLMMGEEGYRSIRYFSERLNVSDKTLKDDLKIIRRTLEKEKIQIVGKTGKGILLDIDAGERRKIAGLLSEDWTQDSSGSVEWRREMILKNLLTYSGVPTSLQKLSEEYYVGKASIVNDLKQIEKWLAGHGLSLSRDTEGTRIEGEEVKIREAIASLINEQSTASQSGSKILPEGICRLNMPTLKGLLEVFPAEEIVFVESLLSSLEREEGIDINDIYYVNILTHILICIKRVRDGNKMNRSGEGPAEIVENRAYKKANQIAGNIHQKFGVKIGDDEITYIYQYLSSLSTMDGAKKERKQSSSLSEKVAMAVTDYMSGVMGVDFFKEETLLEGLLLHIRPMLNRLEYNIQIINPLLDEMKQWYPQMLGICKIACAVAGRQFHLKDIRMDEIANLATYYQTMIVKLSSRMNVLVVCHSGFGTSLLLSEKIKQEFPKIKVLDTISSRKLKDRDLIDIDFIISTVPINAGQMPNLMISALLTEQDILAIKHYIYDLQKDQEAGGADIAFNEIIQKAFITIGRQEGIKKQSELICRAELLPKFYVNLWSGHRPQLYVSINAENSVLVFELCGFSEEAQKTILRELYCLSKDDGRKDRLKAAKSKEEALDILIKRR